MSTRILYLHFLIGLLLSPTLSAQVLETKTQNSEKIRGTRFIPCPNFTGKPYLYDKFLFGEIEFTDGTKIANIGLSYCTYRDELVYYNPNISAQILIDKISLRGFLIQDSKDKTHIFRRLHSTGYSHDESFYEVLSEGKISFLAYRKVNLEPCDTYYSKSGLAYQPAFTYFLYSPDKGFSALNLNRSSFLSKFSKPNQKVVKKLLRKNGIFIADESSMVKALILTKQKGIDLVF